MSNTIQWNSDEGRQYLNKMDSTISEIKENLAKVSTIVNLDQNIWSGMTRESFINALSKQEKEIRACLEDMDSLVRYLDKTYANRDLKVEQNAREANKI